MKILPQNFNIPFISTPRRDISNYMKYPNLAPLKCDTVSFTSRAQMNSSARNNMPKSSLCKQVYENAEPAKFYLDTVLNKYIGPLSQEEVGTGKYKSRYLEYVSRRKTPTSIMEKVASKFNKITTSNDKAFTKEVSKMLLENFKLQNGADKGMVYSLVRRAVSDSQYTCKYPPHINADIYLASVRSLLEVSNLFNFTGYSSDEIDEVFNKIKDKVSLCPPNSEHNDKKKYFNPLTTEGVKHYANDICQSRIIMLKPQKEYTARVLSALEDAAKNGDLKITSIENNLPDEEKIPAGKHISDYEYVDEALLRKLAKSVNAEYQKNISKTGYLGIHINVDLSNSAYPPEFNGYTGEIQIIGSDVLDLKEVEDLCYKIKDNKDVVKRGYNTFKEYLLTYLTQDNIQAFDDYTYALYLSQRELKPHAGRCSFKPIEKFGYTREQLPYELDYNILRAIKEAADITIKKEEEKAAEEDKEILKKDPHKSKSFIEKQHRIADLKGQIKYVLS